MDKRYAFYPFLPQARSLIEGKEVDGGVIEAARSRVLQALKHGILPTPSVITDEDVLREISSYAMARVIMSLVGRGLERYVNAEVERAFRICVERGDRDFVLASLSVRIMGNRIPLRDYLRFSSSFSRMRLVNREVKDGWVHVEDFEVNVILKEVIRATVQRGLPIRTSQIPEDLRKRLEPVVKDVSEEVVLSRPSAGRMSKDIPPCMEKIMRDLREGGRVPHMARWALAVFLTKRGWTVDQVVSVFSGAPNFDEKKTRYQVEHIREHRYSMPSCETLRSQGLCVADCGIKNPLLFRKKNKFS